MAVADAELVGPLLIPIELLEAARMDEHWCDKKHRHMAVIGKDGEPCLLDPGRALHDPGEPGFHLSDRHPFKFLMIMAPRWLHN